MTTWTTRELDLRERLLAGEAVVVSLRKGHDSTLRSWCSEVGLLERVDRQTKYGNPYELANTADDQARATVCERYANEHLASSPDLVEAAKSLRGRALACWCAPKQCHADTLAAIANGAKWQTVAQVAHKSALHNSFSTTTSYTDFHTQEKSATAPLPTATALDSDQTRQAVQTTSGQAIARPVVKRPGQPDHDLPDSLEPQAISSWLEPRPGEPYSDWSDRFDRADRWAAGEQ